MTADERHAHDLSFVELARVPAVNAD
jgi:hypothetical protein